MSRIKTEEDDLLDIIRKAKQINPNVEADIGFLIYQTETCYYDREHPKLIKKIGKRDYELRKHSYAIDKVVAAYHKQMNEI